MTRAALILLTLALAAALYHAADVSSLHVAWLMLLAWVMGAASGALVVMEWLCVPTAQRP